MAAEADLRIESVNSRRDGTTIEITIRGILAHSTEHKQDALQERGRHPSCNAEGERRLTLESPPGGGLQRMESLCRPLRHAESRTIN